MVVSIIRGGERLALVLFFLVNIKLMVIVHVPGSVNSKNPNYNNIIYIILHTCTYLTSWEAISVLITV